MGAILMKEHYKFEEIKGQLVEIDGHALRCKGSGVDALFLWIPILLLHQHHIRMMMYI
jgi:hypothetical protein